MIIPLKELEGLTYTEHINLKNGLIIIKNFDKIISALPEKRRVKIQEKLKEFDFLLTLKKLCKNNSPIVHTTYKFSKSLGNYGRLFANSGSLQNLPREFRNALGTNYHDLDMKNAHPEILYQYCSKNGIKCDISTKYINNRDEILESIEGAGKTMFLKIMNGSKIETDNPFLIKFKEEIKIVHKIYVVSILNYLNLSTYKKNIMPKAQ